MFEQHPVPQNISSYQFRLVGDMTLKQFFELAGGAVVALLFYSSPLHPALRWPLVIFSVILGAALAFLPLQDRPLEQWLFAFFGSIYRPTLYFWKADSQILYFAPEGTPAPVVPQAPTTPGGQPAAPPQKEEKPLAQHISNLEKGEVARLQSITNMFNLARLTPTPQQSGQVAPSVVPAQLVQEQAPQPVQLAQPPQKATEVIVPGAASVGMANKGFQEPQEAPAQAQTPGGLISQLTGQGSVPRGQAAQFSDAASPPLPPEKPNLVSGQVLDNGGNVLEGAILEIVDQDGRPARALKTNRVGHFYIVTPLVDGKYTITIDKDGFVFDPITFEAKGEIIPPIAIKAKAKLEPIKKQ